MKFVLRDDNGISCTMESIYVFMESDMKMQTFQGIITIHLFLITEEVANQGDES